MISITGIKEDRKRNYEAQQEYEFIPKENTGAGENII
jgi:hypothetical protein